MIEFLSNPDDWLEGFDKMTRRKFGCEGRMSIHDALSPIVRAVSDGLPVAEMLYSAIAAGCRTQADAEDWLRSTIGSSCVES